MNGNVKIILWIIGTLTLIFIGISGANYATLQNKVDQREMNQVFSRMDRLESKIDLLLSRGR